MPVIVDKNPPVQYCLKSSFSLFEQLAEATRDWELDFRQLDGARRPFRLEQLFTPDMHYSRIALDSHFYVAPDPPKTIGHLSIRSGLPRCENLPGNAFQYKVYSGIDTFPSSPIASEASKQALGPAPWQAAGRTVS